MTTIENILKLKENEYALLRCKKCLFKVYLKELKIFKECGQCGSKNIEVIK
jgi:Zn finger protein HypA/HybF involved in hydrogenase expression